MVREVLTINIGQAGIQLGQSIWRQYNGEHQIDNSGKRDKKLKDTSFKVFYEETGSGQYVPRNLSVTKKISKFHITTPNTNHTHMTNHVSPFTPKNI